MSLELHSVGLLDLPREVLTSIFFHIYANGSSIIPIISACRELYNNFQYLIYMTKVIHIREHHHLIKSDPNSKLTERTSHILKTLNDHKYDISPYLAVLKLKSSVSIIFINRSDMKNSFTSLLPKTLPFCLNLVILNIVLDSPLLLFKAMNSLPTHLRVLVIRFQMRKTHFALSNLQILEKEFREGSDLKQLENLEYFEISSKFKGISNDHIHPELGKFRYSISTSEETTVLRNNESVLTRMYQQLRKSSNERNVKILIGKLFYDFLNNSKSTLLKIEITGVDMSLIFNQLNKPMNFPKLRMFFMDNSSRLNLHKWLIEFQLSNFTPTFEGLCTALLIHDTLGNRLYFKSSSNIGSRLIDIQAPEISLWSYSANVSARYALFARELKLEY